MEAFLSERPAWFVLGPLVGLVVLGLAATINQRIGALGGYSEFVERASGRLSAFGWKAWFLFGIVAGAFVLHLLAGTLGGTEGYGWLSEAFGSGALVGLVLVVGGILIGFGAKTAGGCTSGNGLGGCSAGSPASFAATATFMATAIVVSLITQVVFL